MRLTRLFGFSLAAAISTLISWTAHAAAQTVDAVIAFVEAAFPAAAPPELVGAMATAPRVTGLHETRAFHQRLLDHSGDGRRRAPMSQAFAAAA